MSTSFPLPIRPLLRAAATALSLAASTHPAVPAHAGEEARRNGDHPAVVVQRLQKNAGYDYAAKFYPHPAWLWLHREPPGDAALAAAAPASEPQRTLARVSVPR